MVVDGKHSYRAGGDPIRAGSVCEIIVVKWEAIHVPICFEVSLALMRLPATTRLSSAYPRMDSLRHRRNRAQSIHHSRGRAKSNNLLTVFQLRVVALTPS